jgi:thymidine kinase|tara:strand:+ start:3977 stop:4570 length:594 start_codon:yes stop_codon:yes gene_type:complete
MVEVSDFKRIPEFIIFTGPMFGSKTTRLMAIVDRFRYQNRNIIAFKPSLDERYSKSEICTHNGGTLPAIVVKSGNDILKHVMDSEEFVDVVAVDEAFMIEGCASALLDIFRKGKTILVSSLQLSATGNVFDEVRDMMPWATKIEICPAVCPVTGLDAYYTHRKFDNMSEITVGGSDLYEPRCWFYHPYMNQSSVSGE